MAIHQQLREDLLREATAYPRRLLISFPPNARPPNAEPVVKPTSAQLTTSAELFAGVRKDGSWSLYFDQDPVIQLNCDGELRRLFWKNRKFMAERGKLVEVMRSESGGRVQLQRQPLTDDADQAILDDCRRHCALALMSLATGKAQVQGCVPAEDEGISNELVELLRCLEVRLEVAANI